MSAKNQATLFSFATLTIFIIFIIICAFLICSCYAKPKQATPSFIINLTEQGNTVTVNKANENNTVSITNTTAPNIIANITANSTANETTATGAEEQNAGQEPTGQTYLRANAVEFYFLLKGKSYFKSILKEQQKKIYNLSGSLVTIQPIIITNDSAKFMVNNYTTKALHKHEWGSGDDFEIYVNEIYYIG